MASDDNAPATHGQLTQVLKKALKEQRQESDQDLDRRFKEQREQINEDFTQALKVANEQLVHDFAGIFKDRTEQHSDKLVNHEARIGRVEAHLGLQPQSSATHRRRRIEVTGGRVVDSVTTWLEYRVCAA